MTHMKKAGMFLWNRVEYARISLFKTDLEVIASNACLLHAEKTLRSSLIRAKLCVVPGKSDSSKTLGTQVVQTELNRKQLGWLAFEVEKPRRWRSSSPSDFPLYGPLQTVGTEFVIHIACVSTKRKNGRIRVKDITEHTKCSMVLKRTWSLR